MLETITDIPTVMSSGYSGKIWQIQYKVHLFKDNFGDQQVLESSIFGLLQRLKAKLFPLADTMGSLKTITGFIKNLPF